MNSSRKDYLPFSPPSIGDEEISAVCDALHSGWLTTGPRVRQLEDEFAAYIGAPAALAVSSCTAAMHLGLLAHGIGPGDEVVTTTMTFAATVNVIEHAGARPVLVDVEPDTLNIDPHAVGKAITPRTRAVLAVHYSGHPADVGALQTLCLQHGLNLIEDAAHALGAVSEEHRVGSRETLAAFSFYATKNLTTGEGGMLTGSPKLVEKVRPLVLHGMSRDAWCRYEKGGSWRYDVVAPGFKYNMTDPAAAMGLVQLRRLDAMQERRRHLAGLYADGLGDVAALELPSTRPGVRHAHHLYPVRLREGRLDINRDRFVTELAQRNIGASVHFVPVHEYSYYRDKYGYQPEDFPVAHEASRRVLSLPLHPGLSDEDLADVIAAVRDVVALHMR